MDGEDGTVKAEKRSLSSSLTALCAVVAMLATPAYAEDPPGNRELYELYKKQQEQIDATADAVDEANHGGTGRWFEKTTLGGYGEVHFNFLDGGNGAKNKSQADFHRFVLFINHEYTDKIRFFSEIELEHAFAGEGAPGEVELEQAFIEFDLPFELMATTGLFLLPVGILNETHEPPTFYGVERNPVEKNIIPTTWWEGGAMLGGKFDHGLSAELAITTGLRTEEGTFNIRSGRQKLAKADASEVALTGRVVYRGVPGLELAASAQWNENISATGSKVSATLFETHAIYQRGPFGMRVLYARWDLHGSAAKAEGDDVQYGFYLEPSYRIYEWLGVFGRYNQFDNSAGTGGTTQRQYDVGFNFWPHENVVLKIDGQFQNNQGGSAEFSGVNLGVGYQF